jgi:cytochrome c-type biogenesis protein CcmH/NrfG
LHHPDKAAELVQQAVHLAPESAEGHYLLGRSLLELGRYTDSVKELESARKLAPNSPEVHFSLARAYAKVGQKDAADQERADFERLNQLVQEQRSHRGSQAYGAIENQNGIRSAQGTEPTRTQSRPE